MRKVFYVIAGLFVFCLLFTGTSYAAVSHTVQPGESLYLIACPYGLTPEDLMTANGLTSAEIRPGQVLTIPVNDAAGTPYTVQPGDTLYLIAQAYGVSADNIIAMNGLQTTMIYPGQTLLIPNGSQASGTPYTVQPGDTLYLIAQAYGVSADNIIAMNGLQTTMIYPGQTLLIPNGSQAKNPSGTPYTVQPGDTLYLIAQAYGVSADNIIAMNGLQTTMIYPGQTLLLPNGSQKVNTPPVNQGGTSPSRGEATSDEAYLLAQLIYAEASGEVFEGQVAVGAVILNRVADSRFANTISGVIFEPWQFEPVQNGQIYAAPDANARRAADAALTGWDPSGGALYFYNPSKVYSPFFESLTYLCTIGNHAFYR